MEWNPFDWTAEPFLILYATLAVLFFMAAFFFRSRLGPATVRSARLRDLELAYLAGGANRLGDVALLCLTANGGATIDAKTSKINVSDQSPLAAIADHATPLAVAPDMTRAQFQKAVKPLADRTQSLLETLGFSPTDDEVAAFRMPVLLAAVCLLVFGAIKAFVGASRHHPVGLLIILLIVTGVIAVFMLASRPLRTRAGTAALETYKETYARPSRAPLDHEMMLAVALSGTVVLTGTAYARVHAAAQTMRDGGGGGDGGGGCGGGGGGGCGGCS
jgi:uncharacterized protein (TIGR04222 family)